MRGQSARLFSPTPARPTLSTRRQKSELKLLMPEDEREAFGHGVRAKRSKSGAISFDVIANGGDHASLQRHHRSARRSDGQGAVRAHQPGEKPDGHHAKLQISAAVIWARHRTQVPRQIGACADPNDPCRSRAVARAFDDNDCAWIGRVDQRNNCASAIWPIWAILSLWAQRLPTRAPIASSQWSASWARTISMRRIFSRPKRPPPLPMDQIQPLRLALVPRLPHAARVRMRC